MFPFLGLVMVAMSLLAISMYRPKMPGKFLSSGIIIRNTPDYASLITL